MSLSLVLNAGLLAVGALLFLTPLYRLQAFASYIVARWYRIIAKFFSIDCSYSLIASNSLITYPSRLSYKVKGTGVQNSTVLSASNPGVKMAKIFNSHLIQPTSLVVLHKTMLSTVNRADTRADYSANQMIGLMHLHKLILRSAMELAASFKQMRSLRRFRLHSIGKLYSVGHTHSIGKPHSVGKLQDDVSIIKTNGDKLGTLAAFVKDRHEESGKYLKLIFARAPESNLIKVEPLMVVVAILLSSQLYFAIKALSSIENVALTFSAIYLSTIYKGLQEQLSFMQQYILVSGDMLVSPYKFASNLALGNADRLALFNPSQVRSLVCKAARSTRSAILLIGTALLLTAMAVYKLLLMCLYKVARLFLRALHAIFPRAMFKIGKNNFIFINISLLICYHVFIFIGYYMPR